MTLFDFHILNCHHERKSLSCVTLLVAWAFPFRKRAFMTLKLAWQKYFFVSWMVNNLSEQNIQKEGQITPPKISYIITKSYRFI